MGKLLACCLGAFLGGTVAIGAAQANAPLSEKIGKRVSRGVVEESLEALDKQENRERLGRILNSPQMRDAMHDLTASIVLGVPSCSATRTERTRPTGCPPAFTSDPALSPEAPSARRNCTT